MIGGVLEFTVIIVLLYFYIGIALLAFWYYVIYYTVQYK